MSIPSNIILRSSFETLLSVAGEDLRFVNAAASPVRCIVTHVRGEAELKKLDRSKVNYGRRGAAVLEFLRNTNVVVGSLLQGVDNVQYLVSHVEDIGQNWVAYCKKL